MSNEQSESEIDLSNTQYYLNRELSWLEFNYRVLHEALDERTPLLERLKFTAIFSSNLDEFLMIRVSTLKEQVEAGIAKLTPDGRTPQQQLDELEQRLGPMVVKQHQNFEGELRPQLAALGVKLLNYSDLNPEQSLYCQSYFQKQVFPILTPLGVDPGHPFPHLSNLSFNVAVVVKNSNTEEEHFARVKVPDILPRKDAPWQPVVQPRLKAIALLAREGNLADLNESEDMFSIIRRGDLLVHHPYESFSNSVELFITQAEQIRRYVHIGTGNYNSKTAKLYTDLGLLSCRQELGEDLSDLFNFLTGYSQQQTFRKLLIAPVNMRDRLVGMIRREIQHAQQGRGGKIIAKMNSLVDPDIIATLYAASQVGVQIDLIVRGICCLRPGLWKISENIRVISIVGRYLEHSRIFYFQNDGRSEIYLGSADWMPRNLDRRVEAVTPVEAPNLVNKLKEILEIMLADNRYAWELQTDGTYIQRHPQTDEPERSAQNILMDMARQTKS